MQNKGRFAAIIATFIPCFIFWLLLTWSLAPSELIAGLVICGVTAWFSSGFFTRDIEHPFRLLSPIRMLELVYFIIFVFGWELIKANVQMAKQVIHNVPTNQGIIKMKVEGITDYYALAVLGDCITMTPGTLTFDFSQEEDGQIYIYVHWVFMTTMDNDECAEIIMGKFVKWIRRIWS